MEQSSLSDVLYVLVVIGRRGFSLNCQVAVLLPQGSFLQIVSKTMREYFNRDLIFPDLQNTIIMHLTTCPVSSYCIYRVLDCTYIQMCTVLPKLFVNRVESEKLMEKNIPQRRFLFDVWLTVHRNSVRDKKSTRCHFVLSFISPLQVAQHVSGNHVPIFRSWWLCSVIATCRYCAMAAGRLSEPVSR